MSGWIRNDADDWAETAEVLEATGRAWPRGAVRSDLRWWADRVRRREVRRIPNSKALADRWKWTEWAVRKVVSDEAWWVDGYHPREDSAKTPRIRREEPAKRETEERQESPENREDTAKNSRKDREDSATRAESMEHGHDARSTPPNPPAGVEEGVSGQAAGEAQEAPAEKEALNQGDALEGEGRGGHTPADTQPPKPKTRAPGEPFPIGHRIPIGIQHREELNLAHELADAAGVPVFPACHKAIHRAAYDVDALGLLWAWRCSADAFEPRKARDPEQPWTWGQLLNQHADRRLHEARRWDASGRPGTGAAPAQGSVLWNDLVSRHGALPRGDTAARRAALRQWPPELHRLAEAVGGMSVVFEALGGTEQQRKTVMWAFIRAAEGGGHGTGRPGQPAA